MFDFNKTPLLPPGTNILVHSKPTQRKSWEFHGQQGWYVAPAPHHYRCVTCYIPSKHREIVSDTIKIIPNYVPIPQTNIDEYIKEKLLTIFKLLQQQKPSISPIEYPHSQSALLKTAEILHNNNPQMTIIQPKSMEHQIRTSEGVKTSSNIARKRRKNNKIPPMSNEEFEKLLRSIKNKDDSSTSFFEGKSDSENKFNLLASKTT